MDSTSCYSVAMRYFTGVLALLVAVTALPGLALVAIVLRLGFERSYELYGPTFTIIAGLGLVPVLACFAFLLDRRERQSRLPEL
jgi:hypothetical protein